METKAHHVIIGAFAIGVFALALGFVLWLSKSSIDREFAFYDIIFTVPFKTTPSVVATENHSDWTNWTYTNGNTRDNVLLPHAVPA